MKFSFHHPQTGGELLLSFDEATFGRAFFVRDRAHKYLTIAWNRGPAQRVAIDEIEYEFPAGAVLPLVVNQSFRFERAESVAAWQFNRDFSCIVDHDRAVGCVGFIFYGAPGTMFVRLGAADARKIELLFEVFKNEFQSPDNIQGEMLRILLVRLIIIVTRLARGQYLDETALDAGAFALVRRFNLLVENHYRTEHAVKFYAARLNKSPKTLANYFALYAHQTPLRIIQQRIALEAKRLFHYTAKTSEAKAQSRTQNFIDSPLLRRDAL